MLFNDSVECLYCEAGCIVDASKAEPSQLGFFKVRTDLAHTFFNLHLATVAWNRVRDIKLGSGKSLPLSHRAG